jgi:hypothetical protein
VDGCIGTKDSGKLPAFIFRIVQEMWTYSWSSVTAVRTSDLTKLRVFTVVLVW